jgi:hypothetical protein
VERQVRVAQRVRLARRVQVVRLARRVQVAGLALVVRQARQARQAEYRSQVRDQPRPPSSFRVASDRGTRRRTGPDPSRQSWLTIGRASANLGPSDQLLS